MENQSNEPSLHDALAQATETKLPGSDVNTAGWNFEEEVNPQTPSPETSTTTTASTETTAPSANGKARVPDEIKKQGAETSALLLDGFLQVTGTLVLNNKFKKRFTVQEMQIVDDENLEDKKLDEVEEQHKLLKRKFDRLLKKRDKKVESLGLDEDEHKSVYTAFYNYYKVKDITMPPEMLLYFTLGSIVTTRLLEVTMD